MHQPENPARRTLLAQTVAGSAALALGAPPEQRAQ
ncbi:hypothetical protein ACET4S_29980, partial [Pseudomonas aeruginosa]